MAITRSVADSRLLSGAQIEKSLAFNGTSDYATIPVTPSTTGFSIGMWIQLQKIVFCKFADYESAADTDGVQLKVDNTVRDYVWTTNNGASFQTNISTNATVGEMLHVGKWVHIVYTFGTGGSYMYINGKQSSLNASAVMSVAAGQTLTLGRNSYSSANFFPGKMKNVTVQNKTTKWTATEVWDLFRQNKIPSGAIQYSMNDNVLDQNGANGLTLFGTTYSADAPFTGRNTYSNRLKNSGFEYAPKFTAAQTTAGTWFDGTSAGSSTNNEYKWAVVTKTNNGEAKFDSIQSYSGSYSMKLSTTGTNSLIEVGNYLSGGSTAKTIPVLPSTSYTGTYYMKTNLTSGSSTTGATCVFIERTGDGNFVTNNVGTSVLTTTDWTKYSISFTTGATTRFITVKPSVTGNDGSATLIMAAWFDDITLDTTTPTARLSSTSVTPITYLETFGNYSDQKITPIDVTALSIGLTSDYSIGARVFLRKKVNTNNTDNHGISNSYLNFGSVLGYAFQIGASDGAMKAVIGNSILSSSVSVVPYNQWTWVVWTLTGTTLKGYVDGSLVWTQSVTRRADDAYSGTNAVFLQEYGGSSAGRHFFGLVRDIFSTRTLLDQTAVTNIVSNDVFPTTDIRYKTNEGGGGILTDYSGNGNHGILNTLLLPATWGKQGRTNP